MADFTTWKRENLEKLAAELTEEVISLRQKLGMAAEAPCLTTNAARRETFFQTGFLDHLVTEEWFTAKQLLHVIDRPDRWMKEFEQFKKGEPIEVR